MPVAPEDLALEIETPPEETPLSEKGVRDRDSFTHDHMRYIIGSYFRLQTFHFLYCFSRNEFKMGPDYKRFWIQPLNFTSILMLPWVLVDIVDSLFFRLIYTGYCKECNWKYIGRDVPHNPQQCAYNKEYTALINEILTGHIARSEEGFQKQAMAKIKEGQHSAYVDLRGRKSKYEGVLDVACIWFSCGLIVYGIVVVLFPLVVKFVLSLYNYERIEINFLDRVRHLV